MNRLLRTRLRLAGIGVLIVAVAAAKCYGQTPSASAIFARYIIVSGGETALQAVTTRVLEGHVVAPGGKARLEIIEAAPDRFLRIIDSPVSGHSENGFDGRVAWTKNSGGTREMSGPPVGMVKRELHLRRPLVMKDFYSTLSAPRPDTLGGARVFVITAMTRDSTAETLYFDEGTGLLAGWDAVVGGTTIRNRLDDYRRVDGAMVPFRVVRSRPDFRWSEELDEVRHNVPVDTTRFAKPPL